MCKHFVVQFKFHLGVDLLLYLAWLFHLKSILWRVQYENQNVLSLGALSGRLMDGASPAEGYLELPTQSGEWKRVCEDSLTERVAEVICRELGYPGFKKISYENSMCNSDHLQDNCTRAPTCNSSTYILFFQYLFVEYSKVTLVLLPNNC